MGNNISEMGKRIHDRRIQLKIKQYELAKLVNISNNHMSSIERGVEKPSIDLLLRLCEELQVTPDYLLLGNMHSNNVSKNISESLRLCSDEDIRLAHEIIELLVSRNREKYNSNSFI